MRRARIAELTSAIAMMTSACSLVTSLDGLSGGAVPASADGAAGNADGAANGSIDSGLRDAGDDAGASLHPQGTFEMGSCDPWVGFQANVSYVSPGHTGNGACRVCAIASMNQAFTGDDTGVSGSPVVGASYDAEAWVKADPTAPAPPSIMLHLRSFTAKGGNFVSLDERSSPPSPIGSTWQRFVVSVDITKPGGRLNVFVGGAGPAGTCFLFDDVVVRRTN